MNPLDKGREFEVKSTLHAESGVKMKGPGGRWRIHEISN